jgi:putative acetyltransferase
MVTKATIINAPANMPNLRGLPIIILRFLSQSQHARHHNGAGPCRAIAGGGETRHKTDMVHYREEGLYDRPGIRALLCLTFHGTDEIRLVDRLWADGEVIASLVAVDDPEVVGHVLLSRLPIETKRRTIRGASLAPLAVRPDRQRQRIGSRLVEKAIDVCRAGDVEAIVVLGHPEFYPRFGFSAITAERLRAPFSGPSFMALELAPAVLTLEPGTVRYPSAFGLTE